MMLPKMTDRLTTAQKNILFFMLDITKNTLRQPSLGEIADQFGITKSGAHYFIRILAKKGFIEQGHGLTRSITFLQKSIDLWTDHS